MTGFLISHLISNYHETDSPVVRRKYGTLSSITGAVTNLLLACFKLLMGFLVGSISVMADAANNLSDMASCIITMLGFRLAGRPADKDHPFGHGRYEYLAGLAVGALILIVGFEFVRTSIQKIIHPEAVTFRLIAVIILLCTILSKLWLGLFYRKIGTAIHSPAIFASSKDSFSDCLITAATLISIVCARFSTFPIDGYLGLLISLFVLYSGWGVVKDTVNPLLGEAPDPELVKSIEETICSAPDVLGIHDLIVHNYGPGRIIASAHAEVPCNVDILKIHDTIDLVERELSEKYSVLTTIHLDPIDTNDEKTNELKAMVLELVHEIDSALSIHDFRIVSGETHTNLIFDIVLPHRYSLSQVELKNLIDEKITEQHPNYFTVITFDTSFI